MFRVGVLLLALVVPAAGCHRGAGAQIPAQPIRDEKEPGESVDTLSAVPDSSGGASSESHEETSAEIEVEEEGAGDAKPDGDGEAGDTDSGGDSDGDESGSEVEIEIDED
jgi:hypothetical protein